MKIYILNFIKFQIDMNSKELTNMSLQIREFRLKYLKKLYLKKFIGSQEINRRNYPKLCNYR